jgi:hypothetical protein
MTGRAYKRRCGGNDKGNEEEDAGHGDSWMVVLLIDDNGGDFTMHSDRETIEA